MRRVHGQQSEAVAQEVTTRREPLTDKDACMIDVLSRKRGQKFTFPTSKQSSKMSAMKKCTFLIKNL